MPVAKLGSSMAQGSQDFDLVIVGAGPAGSAAAVTARRAGLTVALIDKAVFPRDKLCGGLVSGRSLKALERIFGARPSRDLFLVTRQMKFAWAGEELAQFRAPHELWLTMRCDFDHVLFQAALAAGAEDFTGQRWDVLDQGKNRITLKNGQNLGFRALIGADGATSPLAAQLFGRAFDPALVGFGIESECARNPADPAVTVVDFGASKWGYGWYFPKQGSLTVGVCGLQSQNPDWKATLSAFMPEGVEGQRMKGALLPFGDFRRKPGRGNILLVGDAAGLVDSLTGEGIAFALESGAMAADAVAQVLAKGKPDTAAKAYFRALKGIHSELARVGKLRQIVFSKRFEPMFREKLKNSKRLRQVFFDLIEGDLTYLELEKMIAGGVLSKLGTGISGWWPGRG